MLYNIAFFIFAIFYLPVLIFRGKLHKDFAQRFGVYDEATRKALAAGRGTIWIQAVSVGEVALCKGLIAQLRTRFPDRSIVISTITKTGNDLAKKLFSHQATVVYFPLDFSFTVRKAIELIRPSLYIMVETEIWPGVLKALACHGTPSIMINGRISDRSFGKYRIVAPLLKKTLERIDLFCMQSQADAERIGLLGAPSHRVRMTGNMKFDIDITQRSHPTKEIYPWLKRDGKLIVAGSTHEGEETVIVEMFSKLLSEFPNLELLIAPRHIERSSRVEEIVRKYGFEPIRLSTLNDPRSTIHESRIYILDTIGRLNDFYAIAALVFIGGSLIKHGGQNPIEPALFERPVIFGPHMFNFKTVAPLLVQNGGARQVHDDKELIEVCRELLRDPEKSSRLGKNAKKMVLENRGATERNVEMIARIIR